MQFRVLLRWTSIHIPLCAVVVTLLTQAKVVISLVYLVPVAKSRDRTRTWIAAHSVIVTLHVGAGGVPSQQPEQHSGLVPVPIGFPPPSSMSQVVTPTLTMLPYSIEIGLQSTDVGGPNLEFTPSLMNTLLVLSSSGSKFGYATRESVKAWSLSQTKMNQSVSPSHSNNSEYQRFRIGVAL